MVKETHAGWAGFASGDTANRIVVFTLDGQRFALGLSFVERIVRSVEIVALPKAPEIVLGVINVQGEIVPVMDVRKRFRLPQRDENINDHLLIARTSGRRVALAVDAVTGVIEISPQNTAVGHEILAGLEYVEGIVKLEDGLILIHDLDTFLSLEEEKELEKAMKID